MDLDKIDPNFVKDLLASDLAVWVVARNLRLSGYTISLPAIKIRPDVSQIQEFGDSGDLIIGSNIIEVKQRPDLDFNSLKEFPYDSCIVDVVHHFDGLSVPPTYYVICNKSLSGAIVVASRTKDRWTISTRWDNKRKRERTFYLAKISDCHFWDFREAPRFKFE
jgi:hypothetical protein